MFYLYRRLISLKRLKSRKNVQSFRSINQSLQTAKILENSRKMNKKKDEICFNPLPVLNEFNVRVLTLLICTAPLASYNKWLPA
jgi:hypothetical protein